jgi:CheY-like chemotaxis protein
MDGIEATQIIRNERKLTIPIIALTANAFKSELEQAKAAGMNDHIIKPFEEDLFIKIIAKHTIHQSGHSVPEEKLYLLNSLISLSRGNNEFIKKMISIFISQTQETLNKTKLLMEEGNYSEIGKLFHKIKPSIDSLEIRSITAEVLYLEQIAKEENPDSSLISSTFEKVKNTLNTVIEQLKQQPL